MDSDSLPTATSPKATDDAAAVSRRTFTGQGETQRAIRMAPEGKTSAAGHLGEQVPLETGDGGHIQYGPQPNTTPEASAALDSRK